MKVTILEYRAHKAGIRKVQSHNKNNGKWTVNPKFDFHKRIVEGLPKSILIYSKEYTREMQ